MATTRIIPMHINKGKTIRQCLTDRIDYAENPDKTENGELVSSFACAPQSADAEFLFSKRQYKNLTGRTQENDVIAYQIRQSFVPGEVTPEEANRIGYEFAERFLKGKHAFIVATHMDRKHLHNHIIWNSTTLDCKRKFRNFFLSYRAVRKLSDQICLEHRLSIVENPKKNGKTYNIWQGEKPQLSNRDKLRLAIDEALQQKPSSFEELLQMLRDIGYEIKIGKQPAFRGAGDQRFMRMDTLGSGYSINALTEVIAGKREHVPYQIKWKMPKKVSLIIDIQQKLQEGKGAGYAQWARVFNTKQLSQSINYLDDHGIREFSELTKRKDAAVAKHHELMAQMKEKETRIAELNKLRTSVIAYLRTRDTFAAYRKSGYSKDFLAKHEAEILEHRAAKKVFNELGLQKLPSVKSLHDEIARLSDDKKRLYDEYREAQNEMRQLLVVHENLKRLFHDEKSEAQTPDHDKKR